MQIDGQQKKILEWVDAKQPVLGLFHNMENIKPMIDGGLVVSRPVPRAKGQLIITDAGKAVLATAH